MALKPSLPDLVGLALLLAVIVCQPSQAVLLPRRARYSATTQVNDSPTRAPEPETCQYCHCKKVYLDAGTNIGVQIRKLYEPEKFPGAPALRLFDRSFGVGDRQSVCAFGFEPNPRHSEELRNIEETYNMLGYPVKIFTRTAVSHRNGLAKFHLDDKPRRNDWGATLLDMSWNKTKTVVKLMDFSAFILEQLSPDATIVMKMDIEGSEYTILPSLLLSGALCKVGTVYMEWHPYRFRQGWVYGRNNEAFNPREIGYILKYLTSHANGCRTRFVNSDDEKYGTMHITDLPLPDIVVPDEL